MSADSGLPGPEGNEVRRYDKFHYGGDMFYRNLYLQNAG
jgi:hypothetical protein